MESSVPSLSLKTRTNHEVISERVTKENKSQSAAKLKETSCIDIEPSIRVTTPPTTQEKEQDTFQNAMRKPF